MRRVHSKVAGMQGPARHILRRTRPFAGRRPAAAAPTFVVLLFVLVLCWAAHCDAGTLSGTVRNGTTGQVAAGVEVILIQLQGGMQPVATVKTDLQGRYRFDRPEIGSGPLLVRVPYRGVNYHEAAPPGKNTADLEIFEPTKNPRSFAVSLRVIVLQPKEAQLLVGEEFTIENRTQPPVAYYEPQGTFEFRLPESAQFNQASAWRSQGMPLVQATIDKGKKDLAIAFPFRPGESTVRLSYQMPYAANHAVLEASSPYAAQRVLVIVPPAVQVLGTGFQPAGTEQGWDVFARDAVAANAPLEIAVSGSAPAAGASGNTGNASEAAGSNAGSEESARLLPGRLEELKWTLVGCVAALFVLGLIFLWRRAPAPSGSAAPESHAKNGAFADAVRAADTVVRGSIEELKETLFRLELRRQAGTISDEEYARQRVQAEQALRALVRG